MAVVMGLVMAQAKFWEVKLGVRRFGSSTADWRRPPRHQQLAISHLHISSLLLEICPAQKKTRGN